MEKVMLNDIYTTRQKYSKADDFIDLISTDLSKIYSYPTIKLKRYISKYIDSRVYEPDPKGLLIAREAITKYTNMTTRGTKISPTDIFITASTSESYNLIFQTLSKSNDTIENYEVLLPNPGYPLFEELTKYSNLVSRYYKLERSNNWEIDIESIERNISVKTRFIVIISPNNPTGNVINKEKFEKICAIANQRNIIIIIDEVFKEFVYEKEIIWNFSILKKISNLIIFKLNGISKLLALPDMKLAWIEIFGDKNNKTEIIESLEINNDMFLSSNSISQNILPDLFKDMNIVKEIKDKLILNREVVKEVLLIVNKDNIIEYTLCQGGIHLILTTKKEYIVKGKSNEELEESFINGLLKKEHVFIHPGFFYDFHEGNKLSFVISIANNPKKIKEGLTRLFNFLNIFNG